MRIKVPKTNLRPGDGPALISRRMVLAGGAAAVTCPGAGFGQSSKREVEGGIGGTGIVGLLTDFGSLIVAGNYLNTDDGTQYSDAFGQLAKSDLQLGHSLTVEAGNSPQGLRAARVHITYPLVGMIRGSEAGGRRLSINGVTVTLDTASRFGIGDRVVVSGLWDGNTVRASLLAPARGADDLISGDTLRAGGVMVGGVRLRGGGIASSTDGGYTEARGRFDPATGEFRVRRFRNARFVGAAGALKRLSIEGYLAPTDEAPGFRIAGLGHSFARQLRLDRFAGQRVLFNGRYTGRFAADTALVLPEGTAARRRVLSQKAGR